MIFSNTYTIGLEDLAACKIASNRAIFAIMEDIAGLHSASIGCGVTDIESTHCAWVLLDWKVEVIKRPEYNDKLKATTWSRKYDKLCAYRDFAIYNEADEKVAIGTSRWLYMNLDRRRPVRLTEEFLSVYETEEGRMMFDSELDKIDIDSFKTDKLSESSYTVLRRDMDINGHVHNLSYLDMAYEVIPEDVYKNVIFNNIRVEYKKEITDKSSVTCSVYKTNDVYTVIFSTGETMHAVVQLS